MMQRGNASLMVGASSWKDQFIDAFTVQAGKYLQLIKILSKIEILNQAMMMKKKRVVTKEKKESKKRKWPPRVTISCTF